MTNGGWTRLGRFNGTTDDFTLSRAQALSLPFQQARLALNDAGTLKAINCSDQPVRGNLQTTSSDVTCSNGSGWHIRFNVSNPVSTWANYGFYRGNLSTNNGGCSWPNDGTIEVWGRHNPSVGGISGCTALSQGEIYASPNAFGSNYLYMYVK